MKATTRPFLVLCFVLFSIMQLRAQTKASLGSELGGKDHGMVATNIGYLGLTGVLLAVRSALLILPLEAEFPITPSLSLRPSLISLVFGTTAEGLAGMSGFTLAADCALAWYPQGHWPRGWYLSAAPGIAISGDSSKPLILGAVEGGYQWLFPKGLVLGLGAGGRLFVMTDGGYMPIPDIRLKLGWRF